MPWRGLAIAGPTASGKSRLALDWARRHGGVIINADAMQVYRDLRVLTARPGADEEALVPHRLYGVIDAAEAFSAQDWAERAAEDIAKARAGGLVPVLVGGTGLYFRALFKGLAALPDIPADIRRFWREKAAEEGAGALYEELQRRDPAMAGRLRAGDTQRLTRALEVLEATGRSLASFQGQETSGLETTEGWRLLALKPERPALRARIARRAHEMIAQGALEEVRQLVERCLSPDLPAMKAIGVVELAAHLDGAILLEEACDRMVGATNRYAKRQLTWIRTQMTDWQQVSPEAAASLLL